MSQVFFYSAVTKDTDYFCVAHKAEYIGKTVFVSHWRGRPNMCIAVGCRVNKYLEALENKSFKPAK